MDKEIIKATATFSETSAIIMLKKHRKFCRRGLWLPHSLFKNRSDPFGYPVGIKGPSHK